MVQAIVRSRPAYIVADLTNSSTSDERLLAAARSDNEDLLLEIFEEGNFDINAADGCVQLVLAP